MTKDKKDSMFNIDVSTESTDIPPVSPSFRRDPNRKVYNMSFRMQLETADLLDTIARENKTSMQDLVAFAVDKWLRETGRGVFKAPAKKDRGKK